MDAFWIREPGTVKGKFTMVNRLGKVEGGELLLGTWITPMRPYTLVDDVGVIFA